MDLKYGTGDQNLERVELYFLKSILHLPSVAPNMAVFGELGQLPIHLWWKERVLKYWNRICSAYTPTLLKAAFHLSLHNAIVVEENVGSVMQPLFSIMLVSMLLSQDTMFLTEI